MQTSWFQMSLQHCRHCIPSICDSTSAFLHKRNIVPCKLMRSSQPSSDSLLAVGDNNHVTDDILSAVEQFICIKYGKPTASTVNDVWYEVFHPRFHLKPHTKSVAVATQNSVNLSLIHLCRMFLRKYCQRVNFQIYLWRNIRVAQQHLPSVIVEIVEAGTVYTIQRCTKCGEYYCKKWIKATNLVTNFVGWLCSGELNHKIAGHACAAIYYHTQFQQMAGCISMYTSMQTSWFQMSLQHCRHCMPSVDVTAQAHFFTKETQCHVSWCAVVSHPVIQSWQLESATTSLMTSYLQWNNSYA